MHQMAQVIDSETKAQSSQFVAPVCSPTLQHWIYLQEVCHETQQACAAKAVWILHESLLNHDI